MNGGIERGKGRKQANSHSLVIIGGADIFVSLVLPAALGAIRLFNVFVLQIGYGHLSYNSSSWEKQSDALNHG